MNEHEFVLPHGSAFRRPRDKCNHADLFDRIESLAVQNATLLAACKNILGNIGKVETFKRLTQEQLKFFAKIAIGLLQSAIAEAEETP